MTAATFSMMMTRSSWKKSMLSNTIIAIAMRRVTPSYGVPMRPVGRAVKRLKVRECVTLRIP